MTQQTSTLDCFSQTLTQIKDSGLYKDERIISSPQAAKIRLKSGQEVLNFCANNYLGLSNHPLIKQAAIEGIEKWGYGLSSVRFICGTQDIHKQLEAQVSQFLGTEDTILYSSCFDANGGLFEALLGPEDAIISDELNHASIIDGIRLCKAQRFRYKNNDLGDLEAQLKACQNANTRLIATDGVFSMDGTIAHLKELCALAKRYQALVMVDDSHSCGVLGATGKGTGEHHGVLDQIDIITGTFGKAFGGASGGFTTGKQSIIDLLRQKSRPYLFSNSLAPPVVCATLKAFSLVSESTELINRLQTNTQYFRTAMNQAGFDLPKDGHPIVPLILKDAVLTQKMAQLLLEQGIYVIGFSYPVVPKEKARIRIQLSAAFTQSDLDFAVTQFSKIAKNLQFI